ncbi:SGNH/GDSL hydrolase family protein [Singulisphaera sp. Ch08]|uniref:SGNH/GDSL hydrolase family protein n=1 Tax=Singulisphaera sp. Ch08 TaxID=3120278 RepID=A0AAU7C871_9BACT
MTTLSPQPDGAPIPSDADGKSPRLQAGKPPRAGRGVLIRALAVLIGLAPFAVGEAALRALDWQRPALHDDPFVGFSTVHPLFVLNHDRTRYEIPPAHDRFFCPESFDAVKPRGEFRIFCLGGSTVQGRPFAKETSYTTWLELSLRAADPSHPWRVINCGGTSYASYRLAEVMRELMDYQPDLFLIDMSHNEFLEDRTYQHIKNVPHFIRRPLELASGLRIFGLIRSAVGSLGRQPEKPILGPEVEAKLDYRGGLDTYHYDETWRRDVIGHFEFNLRRMVRMAQEARVPVILMNPVYNLDTPPFKSEHRPGLSQEEGQRFEACWNKARQFYGKNLPKAIEWLRQAIAIDDRHAGIHYALAKCYQQLERTEEARRSFIDAKENDVCPLRILEPMSQAILDVGRETGIPVIDLVQVFSTRSRGGILGDDWLVDHVHPSIRGHQLVASVLIDEMARNGFLHPTPGWEAESDRRYQEQTDSLDEFYFLQGQKQLGNLRLWAQGRGDRVRPLAKPKPADSPDHVPDGREGPPGRSDD